MSWECQITTGVSKCLLSVSVINLLYINSKEVTNEHWSPSQSLSSTGLYSIVCVINSIQNKKHQSFGDSNMG